MNKNDSDHRPSRRRQQRTRTTMLITPDANSNTNWRNNYYVLVALLLVLIVCWLVCFLLLVVRGGSVDNTMTTILGVHDDVDRQSSIILQMEKEKLKVQEQLEIERNHDNVKNNNNLRRSSSSSLSTTTAVTKPYLVSRLEKKVVATSDVRGNLGPVSVVIQSKPGSDWIHDRWQAASNMHGKNIPGEHWIQLEFEYSKIFVDRIVLDWETAYADEYILEGSLEPIISSTENNDINNNNYNKRSSKIWTLFDGRKNRSLINDNDNRSVSESGQSPGVDDIRPLHIIHDITLGESNEAKNKPIRYIRLHILKSATGWGVSLWQFDVYGFSTDTTTTKAI